MTLLCLPNATTLMSFIPLHVFPLSVSLHLLYMPQGLPTLSFPSLLYRSLPVYTLCIHPLSSTLYLSAVFRSFCLAWNKTTWDLDPLKCCKIHLNMIFFALLKSFDDWFLGFCCIKFSPVIVFLVLCCCIFYVNKKSNSWEILESSTSSRPLNYKMLKWLKPRKYNL